MKADRLQPLEWGLLQSEHWQRQFCCVNMKFNPLRTKTSFWLGTLFFSRNSLLSPYNCQCKKSVNLREDKHSNVFTYYKEIPARRITHSLHHQVLVYTTYSFQCIYKNTIFCSWHQNSILNKIFILELKYCSYPRSCVSFAEYVALMFVWGDEYVNWGISTFTSQYTINETMNNSSGRSATKRNRG